MRNNFKTLLLFTLLAICTGCGVDPDENSEVRVQGAKISNILDDDTEVCDPIPGYVAVCENGLRDYKVLYSIFNGTNNDIFLNQPEVNDKLGSTTHINNCPVTSTQVYEVRKGQSLVFVDSLCFSSDYTFNPPNDSIIFSINLQGSSSPLLITLPTSH